ncbi:MAG: phosphotransferase [Bacteroidales bacterium]|nr:phosphotransferase [Bacteroidales bacterium]
MDAIKLSLSDYVLSGGGANGESYDHKTDPSVMLKLYFPGKIQQPLDEMMLARKVYDMGIPTPEPGEYVVTEDGRYGIRFKRIVGKKSYSRATGDEPEKVGQFASEFAGMCLRLHSTHVDTSVFENVKDRYYRLLEANPFFTTAEKDKLGRFIADTPDEDTAVHGDLQYSNAIFVGDKRYFIDLGDFCWGNHLFDVAMVYLCCCLSDEAFIKETFHMPKSLSTRFWQEFAPVYFGADRPLKDIEEQIGPYAGLKTLIIERDTKCPMPEFRETLKPVLA